MLQLRHSTVSEDADNTNQMRSSNLMKNERETTAKTCAQMMMWRNLVLVAAIPFAWSLLESFVIGRLVIANYNPMWLLLVTFIPQPPMLFYLFRLANRMHGVVYAALHVLLTVFLTPFFVIGPLFIPLLVLGDARRLLLDDASDK